MSDLIPTAVPDLTGVPLDALAPLDVSAAVQRVLPGAVSAPAPLFSSSI